MGLDSDGTEGRTQREGVDDRGTHAHLVSLHSVKALPRSTETAEDVAATNDDADLHAHFECFANLSSIFVQTGGVYAIALRPHETFSTEFEQDSLKFCHSNYIY